MTSRDNSDFLQELWYKFINSTYKNKSEALTAFLRSLYSKSLKKQNRLERLFYTNDASGMITILIRQFLNDLEGLCFEKGNDGNGDDNDDEDDEAPIDLMSGNAKNLKIYLESDRGALLLYGIDFVIEQYIQVKQNTNMENLRQNHLRIVQESELSNILATSLISLITYLTNKGLSGFSMTNYQEILHFSDLNLTDYLCNQLNRTSYVHYKRMRKRFSLLQENPLNSDEEDEDDNEGDNDDFSSSDDEFSDQNDANVVGTQEDKSQQLKSRRKKAPKPKPWTSASSSKLASNARKPHITRDRSYQDVSQYNCSTTDHYGAGGQTTIDTEENPDESSSQLPTNQIWMSDSANHNQHQQQQLPMYHISTSLRSAARILGKLSIIDKSRAIEEVSVYLEIVRQAINLLLLMTTRYDKSDNRNPSLLLVKRDSNDSSHRNGGDADNDDEPQDNLQRQNIINNLIRLVDDLLKNLVQSVTILLTSASTTTISAGRKDNNLSNSINVLMGYKVIDRIQSLCQSLNNATNSSLSLASLNIDLHKILIFILLTTTKQQSISMQLPSTQSSHSLTGFIQLFSAWYRCDQSSHLLQQALNHESGDIEHGSSLLSKNRVSLFSLIRDLLSSIQNGCSNRKLDEPTRLGHLDQHQRIKMNSVHHTASLNVIGPGNQPMKSKDTQCCYGILGQLLLNTLLHLLHKDSLPQSFSNVATTSSTSASIIKSKKYRLYPHILTHIRKLTFCCTIDLFQYSTELLTVLLNPNSGRVKSYLMRLLQTVIEISFGFYRNRDECECKYTSRHDTTLILKEIRRVCIPRIPKINSGAEDSKIQYSTTPIDLLHFVDWLARSHDGRMKKLVTEHIVYPILNRLKQISANKHDSENVTTNSNEDCDINSQNNEFYDNNFIGYYENCLVLISSSVLTLLPYLNCQWTNEELELISSVCRTYSNLQPIYYKCLTTVVLSINTSDYNLQLPDSTISNSPDQSPRSIKTRIIRHLLASINFDELMKVMDDIDNPSFTSDTNITLIQVLLHDVHVWNCFRQLFAYSLQFRTEILSNKNCPYIDCAYIMLKQVLMYICIDWEKNQSESKEDEAVANQNLRDCLSLFESLLSFVVDGNIVKSQRIYEGLSCDLLWSNIHKFVLLNFPKSLEISKKLMQSFLACCFRQKWTVHDGLYQLRRKFLDSVNSVKFCLQNTPSYSTAEVDDKTDLTTMPTHMSSASDNESDNDDDDDDGDDDDDESRNSEDNSDNDDNNDDDNDSDDEISIGHNENEDEERGRRMRIGFSRVWRHKKYNVLNKSSKGINNRQNQRVIQRKLRNTKIIAKENKQFRFSDHSNYEADVSSDTHGKRHFGNNVIDKYYIPHQAPDLLQTLVEKADIFLYDNSNNHYSANVPFNQNGSSNNNNFDINPCLVELTAKILLSLPQTEIYQQLCLEMLTQVYSVFRTLPWQLQRPFVLDGFLEECYGNIEAILLDDTLPELQMVLLKLLLLPSSDWLTSARLRFAVDISQKNPAIAESILKIILEKCTICSSLQPDKALVQPTTGHQISKSNQNPTISCSSNQNQPETIINVKLTNQRWPSLDPDYFFKSLIPTSQSNPSGLSSDSSTGQLPQQQQSTTNKNDGFSISMWMKLDSRIMKSGNKKHNRNDTKKYKKRLNKQYNLSSPHKSSSQTSQYVQSFQEEAFLHVVSLYSQDKSTKINVQCLQVWCKPSAGSLMLRLYQQVEKLPADTTKHKPNPKTTKTQSTKNHSTKRRYTITFPWQRPRQSTTSTQPTPNVNEPFVIIDPNLINSFNLVGESVVTNFISTNNWNFISITLDWCCHSEFAEITWLLNSNAKRHTKLFKSPYHTIRHNNTIESFISLGHVIDEKEMTVPNCPRYLLGSLFVFEDPILRTSLDNLSLMLLGLNWDGELNNCNQKFDHQLLLDLALVTLILLVDNEPGVERAAELMKKGQRLLWKPVLTNQNELLGFSVLDGCDDWTWWERIRVMQEHLMVIFLADDNPCVLSNPNYKGPSALCLPNQQLPSNPTNPLSTNYTIGISVKNSLDIAFDSLGGISFVLFWLAKLIEDDQDANTKLMLKIYLCLIRKSGLLCFQNHQDRGYSILLQIFKTFKFDLTPEIIDNLIRHSIYESPVRPSIHMTQTTNTKQLCRDSNIIRDLLLQWKIWSCSKEISKFHQQIAKETTTPDTFTLNEQSIQIDLLLLNQINNLLIESNQYSIINCINLDNGIHSNGYYGNTHSSLMTSILDALLNCCYEPFDYLHSNGLVLPREIFEVLIKIIHNALPTQVDQCMVDKLCLTILQLYPVTMKETSMNIGVSSEHNGQFCRTLRSFSNVKYDNLSTFNPFETFYSQIETTHKDPSKVRESSYKPINLRKATFAKDDQNFQVSLRESRVSEVEIKLLAQFYRDTLTQSQIEDTLPEEIEENDDNSVNETMLTESTSTIDSKDSQIKSEGSLEKSDEILSSSSPDDDKYLTQQIDSNNDTIQENDNDSSHHHNDSSQSNENESSRTETLAGLLSILHNVLQVKLSDTVIQKLSTNDFCIEFCLHLLTHPSCVVRAKALSLFHVYLYHQKHISSNQRSRFITPTNSIASNHSHINSELQFDVIGYLLSQYPCSSKEVVCEVISLVFGQQQMSEPIMEINWLAIDLISIDERDDFAGQICEDLCCESYPPPTLVVNQPNLTNSRSSLIYNPIQRLKSVISLVNGKLSPIDEMIKHEMNPLGINYYRSVVLLTSVLDIGTEDIDFLGDQLVWNLKLFGFIFQHNALILHCCMKNGLSECIINITNQLSSQINTPYPAVEALQTLCAIISIHIAAAPTSQISSTTNERVGNVGFSNLLDTVDLLAMMMRHKNTNNQSSTKIKSWSNEVIGKMISTIIWNIIDTICWLNAKDPALRLDDTDEIKQGHHLIQRTINYSLIGKVDRDITNKLIKTLNLAFTISLNTKNNFQKSEVGVKFVKRLINFTWELICKCLSCQEIPDKFSLFLSTKEYISKYTGDLIVCMTHPTLFSDPNNKIQVLESLLRFPNSTRAIRYSLLGNSSGTLCLIVNLKNLYNYLINIKSKLENPSNETTIEYSISQIDYLIAGSITLLKAISLEFGSENCTVIDDSNDQINGDAGNLWQQDMKEKYDVWELISVGILDYWQKTNTNDLKEILKCLSQYQNLYRNIARKNIQKFHNNSCRIRKANEFYRRRQWKKMIENFIQPKAVWYNLSDNIPQIYQLDAAEGPSRIRKRFVRTKHRIPARFFNDEKVQDQNNSSPLQYLFDLTYHEDRIVFEKPIEYQLLKCIEDIRINCACLWVSQSGNFVGEFFLSKSQIGFMVDAQDETESNYCYDQLPSTMQDFGFISWPLNQIDLLLKRRFKLRDLAFEIFLKDGRNCLIALNTVQERDNIFSTIETYLPSSAKYTSKPARLNDLQHQWVSGELTNFDYLTLLNTAAGRSHNDTMQYPVFPFILTNYSTPTLNLTDEQTFRNLSYPISVQTDKQRERVEQSFRDKAEEYTRQLEMIREMPDDDGASIWAMPPHHYSSLYSNAATILYYLVRVPPFTQKSIEFQDNEFDRPDRLFHTLESAWTLSTTSFSCVKELIPEFFYLPEMFLNNTQFNFGARLSGELVDNVALPKWANNDARLFCLIHRAALESPRVTVQLNQWIDLIFGYKQTGKPAMEALNLFHPYTYFKAISPDEITDSIRRRAVEQMIENYGQIPKQLFALRSHPTRKVIIKKQSNVSNSIDKQTGIEQGYDLLSKIDEKPRKSSANKTRDRPGMSVLSNVIGIKWGDYVGSPDNNETYLDEVMRKQDGCYGGLFQLPGNTQSVKNSGSINSVSGNNRLIVIPPLCGLLVLSNTDDNTIPVIKFKINHTGRRIQVTHLILSSQGTVTNLHRSNSFLGNSIPNSTTNIGATTNNSALNSTNFNNANVNQTSSSIFYTNINHDYGESKNFSVSIETGGVKSRATAIAVYQRAARLFIGLENGSIQVYQGDSIKYKTVPLFLDCFHKHWISLKSHQDPIKMLIVNESFSLIISADSQSNVAIWDPQRLQLLQLLDWTCVPSSRDSIVPNDIPRFSTSTNNNLPRFSMDINTGYSSVNTDFANHALTNQITAIGASETLGDIVIARLMSHLSMTGQPISHVSLFTMNAKYLHSVFLVGIITAISYSQCQEGRNVNAIACSTHQGHLIILSSWNLQIIWRNKIALYNSLSLDVQDSILTMKYSGNGTEIYLLHKNGNIHILKSSKFESSVKNSILYWPV